MSRRPSLPTSLIFRFAPRKLLLLAVVASLVVLGGCSSPATPQTVDREVTREVTRVVPQEVTTVVEEVVERIITATAEPAPPEPTAPSMAEPVAPDVDRVGLPEDYQNAFTLFYEFDRPDNRTARVVYANDEATSITQETIEAASVQPDEPFPYGSILVMEVYRTQRDEEGNVVLDENGRFTRDELSGIFVMRKEPGFGAKYGAQRNGEWEYTAYRADGTPLVPPEATGSCAGCHVEAGQGRDWVFGAHRFLAGAEGVAPPELEANQVGAVDYTFTPDALTVPVGTEVTWTSQDVVFHSVTASQPDAFSSVLRPGGRFAFTFEEPGTFDYFCAIHPSMRGQVVATE
ncbi:MAG: cytochrome P460 family protein [Ardenticatenaceae bacterium]